MTLSLFGGLHFHNTSQILKNMRMWCKVHITLKSNNSVRFLINAAGIDLNVGRLVDSERNCLTNSIR